MIHTVFNALVVGCGKIMVSSNLGPNECHISSLAQLKNLKVGACVDTNLRKAQTLANELQCKSYSKLEDAIKDNYYDLVVVATPDHEHFEQICQLVLSKNPPKVIFSEKPVCMNPSQLKKLKNLIASHDVQLLINHSRRIDPNYINLKKEISSRFLGGVTFVNAYYYNGWMHNGVHTVDTLYIYSAK